MTCIIASHIHWIDFPGMIDEPGCVSGRLISPIRSAAAAKPANIVGHFEKRNSDGFDLAAGLHKASFAGLRSNDSALAKCDARCAALI